MQMTVFQKHSFKLLTTIDSISFCGPIKGPKMYFPHKAIIELCKNI